MAPGTAVSMKLAQNGGRCNGCKDLVNGVDVGCCPLTPPDSAEINEKSLTFSEDGHDHQEEPEVATAEDSAPGLCERIKRSVCLASSSSSSSSSTTGTQTDYDPVVVEAKTIFLDIWNLVKQQAAADAGDSSSSSLNWKPRSSASTTMYRVAGQLLDKHSIVYASVTAKLDLVDKDERIDYFAFRVVSDEVLGPESDSGPSQNQISWGRIVALYALYLQVARDCQRRGHNRPALVIADFVGIYVGEKISSWITQQGGWGALERTFPAEDQVEQKVWKGLLVTGIGLGMLATAIKAIR